MVSLATVQHSSLGAPRIAINITGHHRLTDWSDKNAIEPIEPIECQDPAQANVLVIVAHP